MTDAAAGGGTRRKERRKQPTVDDKNGFPAARVEFAVLSFLATSSRRVGSAEKGGQPCTQHPLTTPRLTALHGSQGMYAVPLLDAGTAMDPQGQGP